MSILKYTKLGREARMLPATLTCPTCGRTILHDLSCIAVGSEFRIACACGTTIRGERHSKTLVDMAA